MCVSRLECTQIDVSERSERHVSSINVRSAPSMTAFASTLAHDVDAMGEHIGNRFVTRILWKREGELKSMERSIQEDPILRYSSPMK